MRWPLYRGGRCGIVRLMVEGSALYPFLSFCLCLSLIFLAATSLTRVRIIKRELGIETLNRFIVLLYAYHGPGDFIRSVVVSYCFSILLFI